MCCVGGMVEETTREATDHKFEPQYMQIYFFQGIVYLTPDAATGTKWTVHLVHAAGTGQLAHPVLTVVGVCNLSLGACVRRLVYY